MRIEQTASTLNAMPSIALARVLSSPRPNWEGREGRIHLEDTI
jgi:hypothetical protein